MNIAAATTGVSRIGSNPVTTTRPNIAYIATIRNSPWAKFTTSIRPKMSERPTAMSA